MVWCPADWDTVIVRHADGTGTAGCGDMCRRCPLREQCTTSVSGRPISIGVHEVRMQQAKTEQVDPAWKAAYRATRRKVGVDRELESVDVHGIDHVPREGER